MPSTSWAAVVRSLPVGQDTLLPEALRSPAAEAARTGLAAGGRIARPEDLGSSHLDHPVRRIHLAAGHIRYAEEVRHSHLPEA